ncbi:GtrA family protein [bacterium]|nr:MAG: GtrA family protein [bacterium]
MKRLAWYAVIGGGAVVIDVTLFWLLGSIVGLPIVLANALSIGLAMLYSFALNARYNFQTSNRLIQRFASFAGVSGAGYVLSTAILAGLVASGVNQTWAKIGTLPFVFVLQFYLNSRLTFATGGTNE